MVDQSTRRRIVVYLLGGGALLVVALVWRASRGSPPEVFAQMQALCDAEGIPINSGGGIPDTRRDEFHALCRKLVALNHLVIDIPAEASLFVKRYGTKEPGGAMEVSFNLEQPGAAAREGALLLLPGGQIVERQVWHSVLGIGMHGAPLGTANSGPQLGQPPAASRFSGPATRPAE